MIHLGTRLELFVDHFLIQELNGTRLALHHPVPANRAMTWDRTWEGAYCGFSTVLKDGDRWRLYYRGWNGPNESCHYCLAESDDGITFQRPNLGLHSFGDVGETNIFLTSEDHGDHNFAPFLDTRPEVPEDERYKALGSLRGHVMGGLMAFASADGIHWRVLSEEPVITKGKFDSQNVAFWSETEECYVAYYRSQIKSEGDKGYGIRSISRATSDDFLTWSDPELMTYGDRPLEQLYTNQTTPYFRAPHIYLAFPKRFVMNRQAMSEEDIETYGVVKAAQAKHLSDGVFMTTRGGTVYDRTFMEAFVRPGRDPQNWLARTLMSTRGVWETAPGELSLYYHHRYAQPTQFLQRYTLRTDGFISVQGPYEGGELLTRAFTFTGNRLVLNYATSAAGSVGYQLETPEGEVIDGHSFDDCDLIFGDHIARTVTWQGSSDLRSLIKQPVRLRVRLHDADLWSIQFPA